LALLGQTIDQIAETIGVHQTTINYWMNEHPTFREAIMSGRDQADAEVAAALYHRARGYSCPDDKVTVYKDRLTGEPQVIVTPGTKYYPPDTLAIIFWLKNRQKDLWKDVYRREHTGKDGQPIKKVVSLNLSNLTDAELDMVHALGLKLDTAAEEDDGSENVYEGATKQ
jgi:hypothetical protein